MSGVNALDALRKLAESEGLTFGNREVIKGVIASDLVNFSGLMPKEATMALMNEIINESEWMNGVQTIPMDSPKGDAPIIDWTGPALFPAKENKGFEKLASPVTRKVPYVCAKARSDIAITKDEIRRARTIGITDMESVIRQGWAKAVANTLADVLMNGDEALGAAPVNDIEYSRSINDGILKLSNSGANVYDGAGNLFNAKLFAKMRDMMPGRYKSLAGMKWMVNPALVDDYANAIGFINTNGSIFGATQDALQKPSRNLAPPHGVPFLEIPQISVNQGASAAADAASAQTGFTRVRCDTALGGYAAAKAGRAVRVVYLPTGEERSGVVADVSSHLEFDASDYFGLPAANTTASNYKVYVNDETTAILTNPQNFAIVYFDQWDQEAWYEANERTLYISTMTEFDFILVRPQALVKVTGIRRPAVDWPS